MAKKGKELNPADAHRKKLRKQELKKNKDDKKKKEQIQATHREALRLVEELQLLNRLEKEGTLDKANRTKKEKVVLRLDEINEARRSAGLPAVTISTAPKAKAKVDEEESKWYHPTFNPHGPKKPKGYKPPSQDKDSDDSDDSSNSDSDSDSDSETGDKVDNHQLDLSNLPLPEGDAPMESQFYHNLDLPEIRLDQPKKAIQPPPQIPSKTVPSAPVAYPFSVPPPPFPFPPGMPPPIMPGMAMPGMPPPPIMPGMPPPPGIFPPHMFPPFPPPPGLPMVPPPLRYQPGVPFVDPSSLPQHHHYPPPQHQYRHQHEAAPQIHAFNVRQEVSNQFQPPPALSEHPAKEPSAPSGPVVISAEPKMRDLKKELTQFVPPSLLKKRKGGVSTSNGAVGGGSGGGGGSNAVRSGSSFGKFVVDAAPDVGDEMASDRSTIPKPNQAHAETPSKAQSASNDDEYDAFMKEIGEQ